MLRFLVDLRGEEVDNTQARDPTHLTHSSLPALTLHRSPPRPLDNTQMRDDLITLLIAGHETTAAVLTWLVYALSQHPEALKVVQQEIDEVVGDRYASGRASDREPARRRTATPLLTHPAILLRPQVRDGRGHQEDARGAKGDRRDASHVAGAAAPHPLRDRGGDVARGRHRHRRRREARARQRPVHLDVQHGAVAAAVGGPRCLRPAAVGPAVHQPRGEGVGGVRPRQAHGDQHRAGDAPP